MEPNFSSDCLTFNCRHIHSSRRSCQTRHGMGSLAFVRNRCWVMSGERFLWINSHMPDDDNNNKQRRKRKQSKRKKKRNSNDKNATVSRKKAKTVSLKHYFHNCGGLNHLLLHDSIFKTIRTNRTIFPRPPTRQSYMSITFYRISSRTGRQSAALVKEKTT